MMKRSNADQSRQIRYQSYQKMLRKFSRASYRRLEVSQSQNSLDKSATTSRAWPLPGAFLITPALLLVADLNIVFSLKDFNDQLVRFLPIKKAGRKFHPALRIF
jgi:hypothetical protein